MVNTSYLPNEIETYFRDGARFGVEMAYSFEGYLENGRIVDDPLGSAGAIRKIQDHSGFFDQTFIVLCGDAIIDIDLSQLLAFHREKGAMATIALAEVPRDEVSNYGVAVTDEDGRILEFQEKPSVDEARSTMVNAGIYIFEPDVIGRIPCDVKWDIGGDLYPALLEEGVPFYGAKMPFQWLDIGKLSDYYRVMQLALQGQIHGLSMPGIQVAPGVWTGLNVSMDLSRCEIVPPVYIGGSSRLEPGCRVIGPSMIGPGCIVESRACVDKSVIMDYTRIDSNADVKNMIVCSGYCAHESGAVIDLARSEMDWAISDARITRQALSPNQKWFMEMLFDAMVEIPERRPMPELFYA